MASVSCITNAQNDNCLCPTGRTRTLYTGDNSTWLCCDNVNRNNSQSRILGYYCLNSGFKPFSMQLYRREFNLNLQEYAKPNANGVCPNNMYFLSYTTGVPIPEDGEVCMPNSIEGPDVYLTNIGLFPVTFYTQSGTEIEKPITYPDRTWGVPDGRQCGTCPEGMYCDQFQQQCVPLNGDEPDDIAESVSVSNDGSWDTWAIWTFSIITAIIIILVIVLIVYLIKRP